MGMLRCINCYLLLLTVLSSKYCFCDRTPARYQINLDLPPEERWNMVIDDHRELLPAIIEEMKKNTPSPLAPDSSRIVEQLVSVSPEEYVREMKGIATRSGLLLSEVAGLNMFYEIASMNGANVVGGLGCTSVVTEDIHGKLYHGRNLDYGMTSVLQRATIIADFTRNNKVVFSAITFVLYVGVLTGQRPNTFTLSFNARSTAGNENSAVPAELPSQLNQPLAFSLRTVLQEEKSFQEANEKLRKIHVASPGYLIIAGTGSGEGCIITRDPVNAIDTYCLAPGEGRWFVVQTNYDRQESDEDRRRTLAERYLQLVTQTAITSKTLFSVLSAPPVDNKMTIYSLVMSATQPELFHTTATVRG